MAVESVYEDGGEEEPSVMRQNPVSRGALNGGVNEGHGWTWHDSVLTCRGHKSPAASLPMLCYNSARRLPTRPASGKLRSKTALALCMETRLLYRAPSNPMRPCPMRYIQNMHQERASSSASPASQKRGFEGLGRRPSQKGKSTRNLRNREDSERRTHRMRWGKESDCRGSRSVSTIVR